MSAPEFDFYDKTVLKSYNLDRTMRDQLSMLDTLDVFTRKHCENVANLTCRLCKYLHLGTDFTVYATICAYLHDIGKLFIPASILQKPGALTDEEYSVMKTHTSLGYKMCMENPKLRDYAAGTIYHHEALNGTGYPEGLTKKDIPLVGQIIRVADEYDAIVSKRQYKSHIGITDTLKILIENAIPKSVVLKSMEQSSKLGKINAKVLRKLFKVVIDDTEYEISCIYEYTAHLADQIKRLESVYEYHTKMVEAHSEKKKAYYEECIKMLLEKNETIQNYQFVLEEYRAAEVKRKEIIDNLYNEIKQIKKLKV